MSIKRLIGGCFVLALLSTQNLVAASSDIADAAMNKNKDAVRSLLLKKANVNAPEPNMGWMRESCMVIEWP